MAKLTGPLFSMDARGKFGGALVFSGWKGRSTVRRLVTPANPHSAGQETARNRIRVSGAIQKVVNASLTKGAGRLVTDQAAIMLKTPAGYAWNGHLTDTIVGVGGVNYTAAVTAYTALLAADKTAWNTAAAGLAVPYAVDVPQTAVGGVAAAAIPKGQAFFIHIYALFLLGIGAVPGAVPPTYAA